jgi:CheY-like chemotaxis protein
MTIAVVDDLMFASKIRAAAERSGAEVTFVRTRDAVLPAISSNRPSLVIFDLDREPLDPLGAIRAVRADEDLRATRLAAFVRHTSGDLIAAAREAGIDVVLARSAFFPALPQMLAEADASHGTSGPEPPDAA